MFGNQLQFVEDVPKSVSERKRELRAYMKERRGANENRDVKERLLIENALAALQTVFKGACTEITALVYLSFSSEAPTDGLIERLLEKGYKVCCPRIENGALCAVEYGEDLTLSEFGIREPVGQAYTGKIDVAITPLLAVDGEGNRLGYGGGYYDRYFKNKPQVERMGYCYECQLVKSVPTETGDERLDMVVTEKRIEKKFREKRK